VKNISAALQAHLDTGATTLCWCWKVTRGDGLVQGFTNHDRALTVAAVTYEAASGFTASEVAKSLGLSVDNLSVQGALSSASLNEADLAAGYYDGATIAITLVNWADTSQAQLLHEGPLGDVKRGKTAFEAELLGKAELLNVERGRRFAYQCDATLGDARCTIDLTSATYKGTGAVTSVIDPRRLVVSGLSAYADAWFSGGRILFSSGANSGLAMEVKRHVATSTQVRLELWRAMPETVAAADAFAVTAGCDKQFETCKARFGNAVNFRGFPYMIGNDALQANARPGENFGGGSRYGN